MHWSGFWLPFFCSLWSQLSLRATSFELDWSRSVFFLEVCLVLNTYFQKRWEIRWSLFLKGGCGRRWVIRWIEIVINRIARTASWIEIEVPIDCISFRHRDRPRQRNIPQHPHNPFQPILNLSRWGESPPYASTPGERFWSTNRAQYLYLSRSTNSGHGGWGKKIRLGWLTHRRRIPEIALSTRWWACMEKRSSFKKE